MIDTAVLLQLVKGYFFDVDIVWRKTREEIKKLQNKRLRRIIRYAYSVPVYHKKYKKAGVRPDDIKGIEDIEKLPVITKEDIRENFPDGIVPKNFNISRAEKLSTSGSTGKPVVIYADYSTIIRNIITYVRILKAYDAKWNKTRITVIGDMAYGTAGYASFVSPLPSFIMKALSIKNLQIIDIGEEPRIMAEKINEFKPDFLNGYPGILRILATLKMEEGIGKDISPQYISSSGAVLDPYTRKYIEEAFNARVFDVYESTEGGPIAFECKKGNYHLHSDMVYLEVLDENMQPVAEGEVGKAVITRLYGKGTPIIRYAGMDDFIRKGDSKCSCGMNTECIGSIEGRRADAIITPDGKLVPPLSFTYIPSEVMNEENFYGIKQFQIVQEDERRIVILVVPKGGEEKDKLERIYEKIKAKYEEKFGKDILIEIKEVDKIPTHGNLMPPVVISKVKKNEIT